MGPNDDTRAGCRLAFGAADNVSFHYLIVGRGHAVTKREAELVNLFADLAEHSAERAINMTAYNVKVGIASGAMTG
jgi:hypothetical protein